MESGSAGSEEKVSENYPEAHPFRFSPAVGPPLRIGILLDTPKLSAFFARIIEDIQGSNFANLELLVFRKNAAGCAGKSVEVSYRHTEKTIARP